jgi:hypothetical protein
VALVNVVWLTAAGAAPDWREMAISRVTGFPFHHPAGLQDGTNHVTTEILATNVVPRMWNCEISGKTATKGIYW